MGDGNGVAMDSTGLRDRGGLGMLNRFADKTSEVPQTSAHPTPEAMKDGAIEIYGAGRGVVLVLWIGAVDEPAPTATKRTKVEVFSE